MILLFRSLSITIVWNCHRCTRRSSLPSENVNQQQISDDIRAFRCLQRHRYTRLLHTGEGIRSNTWTELSYDSSLKLLAAPSTKYTRTHANTHPHSLKVVGQWIIKLKWRPDHVADCNVPSDAVCRFCFVDSVVWCTVLHRIQKAWRDAFCYFPADIEGGALCLPGHSAVSHFIDNFPLEKTPDRWRILLPVQSGCVPHF